MRYFIATKDAKVVEKRAISGDDEQIDRIIADFELKNPSITITEADETEFDAIIPDVVATKQQKEWTAFKQTSPTPQQSVLYLAKQMGLE